jgi:transcriptional regulator with XRE-family HTH domain
VSTGSDTDIDQQIGETEVGSQAGAVDGEVSSSIARAVGETLRTWRNEAGLSIREVADRSGISLSFISLVERGQTEIAVTRLIRLTDVFGRQISDVLVGVYGNHSRESASSQAADQHPTHHQWRVYTLANGVEMVYLGSPEWATQPFLIALQPDAIHGPIVHSYKEAVMCLDGEGTMVIDGEQSTLLPGDTINLAANALHAYMNCSSAVCRFLALDSRPTEDMGVLLATWDQIERSQKSGEEARHTTRPPADARVSDKA